jgi:hypothetical protein
LVFSESGSGPFQEFLFKLKLSEDIARNNFLKWFSSLPVSSVETISDIGLPENPKAQNLENRLESKFIDLSETDIFEFCDLLIPQYRMSFLRKHAHFIQRLGTNRILSSIRE